MEDTLTFTSALTQQPVIHTALQGKLQTPVFTEPRQVTPHSAQNDQKCHVFRSFTRAMTLITETHTKSVCLSSCSSLQNTQYLAAYAECPRWGYRRNLIVLAICGTWKRQQKVLFKTKNNLDVWCTPVTLFILFFAWGNSPSRAQDALLPRFLDLSLSHTHTHTPGRTPLEEWSAYRRSRYLHKTHKRRTSMPSAVFEPVIPAIKRLQTTRPPGAAIVTFLRKMILVTQELNLAKYNIHNS